MEAIIYKGMEIYSFKSMTENWHKIFYIDREDLDETLERTILFLFGEIPSSGLVRGYFYQVRVRPFAWIDLKTVWKYEGRIQFRKVIDNQDYFFN